MIKILKAGVIPPPHVPLYRGTCNDCGCEVEASKSDLRKHGDYNLINCPTQNCGVPIVMYKYITRD